MDRTFTDIQTDFILCGRILTCGMIITGLWMIYYFVVRDVVARMFSDFFDWSGVL